MKSPLTLRGGTSALLIVGLSALYAPPAEAQRRCEVRDVRELTLPMNGIESLGIEAGSGSLLVEGRAGVSQIIVTATLCASSDDLMEDLDVRLEEARSRAQLDTKYPKRNGGWGNRYARIDLEVVVPLGLDADIIDGSGGAEIRGIGSLTMDDGSGEIVISDLDGDLRLNDGSGEIEIRDIAGSVDVEDGSGEVEIQGVGGSVRIDDGSGSLRIDGVAQNVEVLDGGSGQVVVHDVDGDLTVKNTKRSRIRYENVGGQLDLPAERRRGRRGGA